MTTRTARHPSLRFAAVSLALAAGANAHGGAVFYVDGDAPAGGDGSTWPTAYRFLADALAAAGGLAVSEIRVAEGVHRPDRSEASPGGSGDRAATFALVDGVAMVGGYAGLGAPDPDARNRRLYVTTLSGDLLGNDGPTFSGRGDNSIHVLEAIGTGSGTRLEGFSIRGGNANGFCCDPPFRGGGLFVETGALLVTDCVFADSRAGQGGAMTLVDAEATVAGCVFTGHLADNTGGAIFTTGASALTLTACRLESNTAENGGGLYHGGAALTLVDCVFDTNAATTGSPGSGGGGAIRTFGAGPVTMTDCAFTSNTSTGLGGAVFTADVELTATGCVWTANVAGHSGGAFYNQTTGALTFTDCGFAGNTAVEDGGGVYINGDVTFSGVLFFGNHADGRGGAARFGGGRQVATGCDFDGNSSNFGGAIHFWASVEPRFTDCTFTGNTSTLNGGALGFSFSANDDGSFTSCLFDGNTADGDAGAVSVNGPKQFVGCTFQNNHTTADGGAVRVSDDDSASFDGCQFSANTAGQDGGAMRLEFDATSRIVDCVFTGNEAGRDGGALSTDDAVPFVIRTTFSANVAAEDGGACAAISSGGVYAGCTIDGNTAAARGGGVYLSSGAAVLRRCRFENNQADTGGGVHVASFSTDATLSGCEIIGNTATRGGGLYLASGDTRAASCVISGNDATDAGGAVFSTSFESALDNCTIYANTAGFQTGGAQADAGGRINLTSCVAWANEDLSGQTLFAQAGGVNGGIVTLSYCAVQNVPPDFGDGNISDDPLFVDSAGADGIPGTDDDDLRLAAGSPCVDAGSNSPLPDCATDADGRERRHDDPAALDTGFGTPPLVDIGAYERGAAAVADCNRNGAGDPCDVLSGASPDCNENGIPDECDIAAGASPDCNENGIPDECDVDAATSPDCNGNGVPDECDLAAATSPDCNGNGIPDECDVAAATSPDCNGNQVPDECDVAMQTSVDCNANGAPDECEVAAGAVDDCNGNGVPDSCEVSGVFAASSGPRSPFGDAAPLGYVLGSVRAAGGDVVIDISASADLGSSNEFVRLYLDGVELDAFFGTGSGASDCADPPDVAQLVLAAATFNDTITPGENAVLELVPQGVSAGACGGESFAGVTITYDAIGPNDTDGDGEPDDCFCPADLDDDGFVGFQDLLSLLAAWGPCVDCPEDLDHDDVVSFADLLLMLARWGPCR